MHEYVYDEDESKSGADCDILYVKLYFFFQYN
jgi:hypothetical protein